MGKNFKKIGNIGISGERYREYFFDYDYYSDDSKSMLIKSFKIADVEIHIGKPSEEMADLFGIYGWCYDTIRLIGVSDDNYEEILEQAFFYITCMYPPLYSNEYPKIIDLSTPPGNQNIMKHQFNIRSKCVENKFPILSHSKVVAYYNYGVSCRDTELAFVYFYKVLEYFFPMYKEKKNQKKISEKEYLYSLLKEVKSEKVIEQAKQWCLYKGDCRAFSDALYHYRCSTVHGKATFEQENQLRFRFKKKEIDLWIEVVKDLAEIVIQKYCFPNAI